MLCGAKTRVANRGGLYQPRTRILRSSRRTGVDVRACSILALINSPEPHKELMQELSARMRHRGPDGHGYYGGETWGLAHERLAIMDPEGGKQPLWTEESAVVVNGEIYNFEELHERFKLPPSKTGSDSEVVLQMFEKMGPEMCQHLNGMFAFVAVSGDGERVCAARDHCGIKPLYMGRGENGETWFASELKAIVDQCTQIEEFPAGHYWTPESGLVRYYAPAWDDAETTRPTKGTDGVRAALDKAIRAQCMSDVPFGLLLSGGLDSAVVGTLLQPVLEELGQPFLTFSVGQAGSPDIVAARMMAEHWGTTHHEYLFTPEEAFAAIPEVVYHIETYEPELIRSAIPNYFLAKLTASTVKMVLTGEGSDELFGGYLYFRDAPSPEAFHSELRRIFHHLHNVNLQRADRMTMAHGLEARVPFLDPDVIAEVMAVNPEEKMILGSGSRDSGGRPEKNALRVLFEGEVPEAVLWRTKAMQCEGVGMNWVATLQSLCAAEVSDAEMQAAAETYPVNPPHTKEELYYRRLFEENYKGMDRFVHVWEGGCRAGGAEWKSAEYTREGLANTEQLSQGLGEAVTV
eukprot:CAMPEP_0170138856 /NCGR_PEP_ID=MMETSP0033_2-20121228/5238_1 /TAXON_ID=195969 /ORGANISM="Dolichomastix tenuilepis, Strain CCMP3274" /LENGTH=575 /DNA_ID=CAMNT_0010374911 /DNA_START=24 /DNA_END=1751 /DNA_ORIENTATION=-